MRRTLGAVFALTLGAWIRCAVQPAPRRTPIRARRTRSGRSPSPEAPGRWRSSRRSLVRHVAAFDRGTRFTERWCLVVALTTMRVAGATTTIGTRVLSVLLQSVGQVGSPNQWI